MIVRRLSMVVFAAIACASAGCIVNGAPEEGTQSGATEQRTTESMPVSPGLGQQPTTNVAPVVPLPNAGFTTMETEHDPAPPRPWEPHPAVGTNGLNDPNDTAKPKIGGSKEDDGTKPTK